MCERERKRGKDREREREGEREHEREREREREKERLGKRERVREKYPRRCKTSSVGQSAGLLFLGSSVRFRQKLQKLRTQIYMDFSYIDPQARVLNYCTK